MGAIISPGQFVRKQGDTMTGQLRLLGTGVGAGLLLESIGGNTCYLASSSSVDNILMVMETETMLAAAKVQADDLLQNITGRPSFFSPSGRLHRTGTQSDIAQSTLTKVLLATISTGFTDAIEDTGNNRILPGVAGYYMVFGSVHWINTADAKTYTSMIYLNGANIRQNLEHTGTADSIVTRVSGLVKLTNTDYLELWAYTNDGGLPDIQAGSVDTFLSLHRVRAA